MSTNENEQRVVSLASYTNKNIDNSSGITFSIYDDICFFVQNERSIKPKQKQKPPKSVDYQNVLLFWKWIELNKSSHCKFIIVTFISKDARKTNKQLYERIITKLKQNNNKKTGRKKFGKKWAVYYIYIHVLCYLLKRIAITLAISFLSICMEIDRKKKCAESKSGKGEDYGTRENDSDLHSNWILRLMLSSVIQIIRYIFLFFCFILHMLTFAPSIT